MDAIEIRLFTEISLDMFRYILMFIVSVLMYRLSLIYNDKLLSWKEHVSKHLGIFAKMSPAHSR